MRWKYLESDRTNNSVANNQAANANLTRADGEQEVDYKSDISRQCSSSDCLWSSWWSRQCCSSYWLWSSWWSGCLRSFPKWCSTWVNMNWITALQASFKTCTLQIIFDIKLANSTAISIHRFQKSLQDFYALMIIMELRNLCPISARLRWPRRSDRYPNGDIWRNILSCKYR